MSSTIPAIRPRAWVLASALLLSSTLLALPWIYNSLFIAGWIGLAMLMWCRLALPKWYRFPVIYLASMLALAIAFHWSPAALAYSMNSGLGAGFAVAIVLLMLDALRLAIPLWLGAYLTVEPKRLWLFTGILAVICESWIPSVFPWRLGYFQLGFPVVLQLSEIFGPSISTLVAYAFAGGLLNAALWLRPTWRHSNTTVSNATGIDPRAPRSAYSLTFEPAVVAVAVIAYGLFSAVLWRNEGDSAKQVKLAIVQAYPSAVESIDNARRLSQKIDDEVDLVCWPESIGGTYHVELQSLADQQKVFDNSLEPDRGLQPWPSANVPLLLGGKSFRASRRDESTGLTEEEDSDVFVSALLLDTDQQIAARYHKRFLMPFGEYVPLESHLPFMEALFGGWDEITPGEQASLLTLGDMRIGVMLCYEDMVPFAARSLAANGANILISVADGSSFENPLTLQQHRLLAQMRAIENRKYFLRCASTGESCVISPTGRIVERLPMQEDGLLIASVMLVDGETLYAGLGEFFPVVCIVGLVAGLVMRLGFTPATQLETSAKITGENSAEPVSAEPAPG